MRRLRPLSTHLLLLLSIAGAFVVLGAACGGGSESAGPDEQADVEVPVEDAPTAEPPTPIPPTPTVAPEPTATATPEPTSTPTPTPLPQCQRFVEEHEAAVGAAASDSAPPPPEDPLEQQWAQDRAAAVQRILDGGYGVRDCVLHGPGGLEVDLSECPSEWSDYGGITAGSIELVSIGPNTGDLAAFDQIGQGMAAVFTETNSNGGVGRSGAQVVLERLNDRYDWNEAQRIVNNLNFDQGDGPFALSVLGTGSTLAVREQLNNECIPHPFNSTGHPALSDPALPWGSILEMGWDAEAFLWVDWIDEYLAAQAPVTVGVVVTDNDFGLSYTEPFSEAAELSSVIGEVRFEYHAPESLDLMVQVDALGDVDVLIGMMAGAACPALTTTAAASGVSGRTSANFLPSVCVGNPGRDVLPHRWLSMGGIFRDPIPAGTTDGVVWVDRVLGSAPLSDGRTELTRRGAGVFGWTWVQTIEIASQLPGGLSRTNLMLAMHSLDLAAPGLPVGVRIGTNGLDDQHPIESSWLARITGPQSREWIENRSVDGRVTSCSWTPRVGCD